MNNRDLIKSVSIAFTAQIITLAVSVIVTLLVPKFLDVENFAYWQLFIFYSNYVGFFMLGLNDGCYLLNGGKKRSELNKPSINSQFLIGLLFEMLVGACLIAIVLGSKLNEARSFVLYCIGVFIPLRCSAAFLGFLFQAINETRLYSLSCIVERLIFVTAVVSFLLLRFDSFKFYVLAFCFSTLCQFVFCLYHSRDILQCGLLSARDAFADTAESMRIGLKLMLANIASSLVLGIARAIIDATWGISSFGQLSLALSLCNFFLAFVSQFAMVLFPALRQSSLSTVKAVISKSREFLSYFMPIVYLLQFPIYFICLMWLPQYEQGLGYLTLALPICVFDSKTNLCSFTYFKVARMETKMLAINCVTVLLSTAGVLIGALLFNSVDLVIIAVVVGIAARSIYCEHVIDKSLDLHSKPSAIIGELIVTAIFISTHYASSLATSFILCVAAYAMYLLINLKDLKSLYSSAVEERNRRGQSKQLEK